MELKEIKLTKEESKYIKVFMGEDETAQTAFHVASSLCKTSRRKLWEALGKLYPNAMHKGTKFDHKDYIIQYIED